jgi:iron complex outermembrane receptor protein
MPRTPSRLRPVAAAFALGTAAAGHAQTAGEPHRLEPVIVRADAEQSLTVPSIERAERDIRRIPGGAGVVDPRTYETGRSSTLSDALSYAPGVFVQPRFGATSPHRDPRLGRPADIHGRGII